MISRRSLLAAPLVLAAGRARASRPYDVALVLATDVSHSITPGNYRTQKDGIVYGLTHRNMELLFDQGRRYLMRYAEWSGRNAQAFTPWHRIETFDDALAFAGTVANFERSSYETETAIAQALRASAAALEEVRGQATKLVVDLSFDGKDNASSREVGGIRIGGEAATRLVAQALADRDIVVNGLIIPDSGKAETLEAYFRSVIAGPRSFSVTVPRPAEFGQMFLRKLLEEVS